MTRHVLSLFARVLMRGACVVLVAIPASGIAAPVRWTFSNATFSDGGVISGSFILDADTNVISERQVAVSGGNTASFAPVTYAAGNSSASYEGGFAAAKMTAMFQLTGSNRQLRVTPATALTGSGGTVALNIDTVSTSGSVECFNCGPARTIAGGSLVGTSVGTFAIGPGVTGNWYDPVQNGHGFQFEVLASGVVTAFWFTFDNAGNQAWFSGAGTPSGDRVMMNVIRVMNGRFPPNFDHPSTVRQTWGTFNVTFIDCNHARVDWTTVDSAFTPSGTMNVQRLTTIGGLTCP